MGAWVDFYVRGRIGKNFFYLGGWMKFGSKGCMGGLFYMRGRIARLGRWLDGI